MCQFYTMGFNNMRNVIGILVALFCLTNCAEQPPNIVFIVADDLGWNDLGFRNPHVISPNIDWLAHRGVILNQSYVQPFCTPSRTAFMTGMYPFKVGMQHIALDPVEPACAALNHTTVAQRLKEHGYATHMIGKWHLGFCKWECTPTYRGFDTFYGFYNGKEDYFNYTVAGGNDFRDNENITKPTEYSTIAYAKRADEIIRTHNKSQPLFLYYPFQSVHNPIQVPQSYEDMYKGIKNEGRRKYLGMVTALDDAIGNLTKSLRQNHLLENTLIIFTSDNGGWPQYFGNNYPLRGGKVTIYEGGTRANAFVYGKGINKPGSVYNGLMHAVDWMPTILSAAGVPQVDDIDGIDMLDSLQNGSPSNRTEFVYNIDDTFPVAAGHAAIRVGDYKLIEGFPGMFNGWYTPPEDEPTLRSGLELLQEEIDDLHTDKLGIPLLFNLKDDPNEHNNIILRNVGIYKKLKAKLEDYKKQMVPAIFPPNDMKGAPFNFGGNWTPGWC